MPAFKIDREKKLYVFDDGTSVPIPKDDQREVLRSPKAHELKESKKKELKDKNSSSIAPSVSAAVDTFQREFLGDPINTGRDYGGAFANALFASGEGQEDMSFYDRILENYYASQDARKEFAAEQEQEHPIASNIGKYGALGTELVTLRKAPAAVALPLLGTAHSDTSILEPMEKGPEIIKQGVEGYLLDRVLGGGSRIANARQARRTAAGNIEQTTAQNLAEQERVLAANAAEEGRFAQETAAREQQLQSLPGQRQAAQQHHAQNISQQMRNVERTMGNATIEANSLGVQGFIDTEIGTSVLAGSEQGSSISKFLKSVFKGSEGRLTGEQLRRGFESLEQKIAEATGPAKQALLKFKEHALQVLPDALGNQFAYAKNSSRLFQRVRNRVRGFIDDVMGRSHFVAESFARGPQGFANRVGDIITDYIQQNLERNSSNLVELISSGNLNQTLVAGLENEPRIAQFLASLERDQANAIRRLGLDITPEAVELLRSEFQNVINSITDAAAEATAQVEHNISRFAPDIVLEHAKKRDIVERALQRSQGAARVPSEPPLPQPVQMQQPNLQPVPNMPEPTNMYERLASGLENLNFSNAPGAIRDMQSNIPGLAALKYLGVPVAKTAMLTLGGGAAAKAFTSPGVGGQMIRGGTKLAGLGSGLGAGVLGAVEEKAEQYPSFQNGILQSPMDRRSLVKELEDDPQMSLEDKAIYQSKINRGIPLSKPLH